MSRAVMLLVISSAVYLFLRAKFNTRRFWRRVIVLLLFIWLAVILAATLTGRTEGTVAASPELIPFHSYRAVMAGANPEILRSNFMNVVLFYPAGLLAAELCPARWSRIKRVVIVTLLFILLSAAIEFCQYCFALGLVEIDDVIHNGFGALAGTLAAELAFKAGVNPAKINCDDDSFF